MIDRSAMLQRFLSYVRIETTSSEESEDTPSTVQQWDLGRKLVEELEALGLSEVGIDEHCYVYATLPENIPADSPRAGQVPVVALLAHMDTADAVSGKDVKPIVHENYPGGSIRLPGPPEIQLTPEQDPALDNCRGLDIVTSDGSTLLGADDKAGIAIIMAVLQALRNNPEIQHGPVKIAFTPDEEIGRGVDKLDVERLGAEVAYTLDGEGVGEVEDETFCADSMDVRFYGVNVHPGQAKGKMINAIKLATELVERFPKDRQSPETTAGREGYVHPRLITGNEEMAEVKLLIRDFTVAGLKDLEGFVESEAQAVKERYAGARLETTVTESYRNMKEVLDRRPEVLGLALEAVRAVGIEPECKPIRGGTDGARLSFMGVPTPNIFTGGHNYHGKREWIVVQHMEKSAEVCLQLLRLWAEKGEKKGLLLGDQ